MPSNILDDGASQILTGPLSAPFRAAAAPEEEGDNPPPISGAGSSTGAWQQHFAAVHPDVDIEGLTRDELIDLHDKVTA
jgi:hypothetical protein